MSGTRLRARIHLGSDGSREFVGWFDNQKNVNCAFQTASDGKAHCLPDETDALYVYGGSVDDTGVTFTDASCSHGIRHYSSSYWCVSNPSYVVQLIGCYPTWRAAVFAKLSPYTGPLYGYTGNPATCQWIGSYSGDDSVVVAQDISAEFVEATEQVE